MDPRRPRHAADSLAGHSAARLPVAIPGRILLLSWRSIENSFDLSKLVASSREGRHGAEGGRSGAGEVPRTVDEEGAHGHHREGKVLLEDTVSRSDARFLF